MAVRCTLLLAIVAGLLHLAAADANAQNRRGMWGRFAGGGGTTKVSADQSGVADWTDGGVGAFSGGWTIRDSLLLGGEYDLWLHTLTESPKVDAYLTGLLGTVTWYPWATVRGVDVPMAFFFKGGAGMLFRDADYGDDDTVSVAMGKGLALNAAVGLDMVAGGAASVSIAFDVWYGYMGSVARPDIFATAHQTVMAITVGLTLH